MSRIVVDASVAAKWFLTEQDSAAATSLLKGGDDLLGPEILVVETAAAIVRRFRTGSIEQGYAQRLLADAHAAFKLRSITLTPDISLLPRAEEMAISLRHPLQDCLYVACAESAGAELVTTDSNLLARASGRFAFVRAL